MYKSGYIALIGRPNVGKSTLMNALLGQKIAAVSSKPQTTRHKILGIKTLPQAQMLFLDTPGIHRPHKSLNEYMMEISRAALDDADVFLLVVEPSERVLSGDREVFQMVLPKKKPVILIINKVDKVDKKELLPLIEDYQKEFQPAAIVPISASKKRGLADVEKEILNFLSEGTPFYPEDQLTDQTERFLASEIVREKIMEHTREELPYAVTVVIESFKEPRESDEKKVTRIQAAIITEKESQKGILIGKGGQMLKKIGTLARTELEEILGTKVYLELFVRVERDWSKDPNKVQEFSYES